MEQMEDLFAHGRVIIESMVTALDVSDEERVNVAFAMTRVAACSLRVRCSSPTVDSYHVISHVVNLSTKERTPFFTVTFEEEVGDQIFDVSIGFCEWGQSKAMFQAEGCFDCEDEEFCSKQPAEADRESFGFYHNEMQEIINAYVRMWSPILADFASSFGVKSMYDATGFILDQVYDCWSEISEELESTIRLFNFNERSGRPVKDPDYCSKDQCEGLVYERGLCLSHEYLCAQPDCFDSKDEGAFCFFHTPL